VVTAVTGTEIALMVVAAGVLILVWDAPAAAAGAIAGATVILGRQAVFDVATGMIAGICLLVLWRFKIPEPYVVVACAIAGIVLHR
jgi:chromate transporter